MTRARQNGLTVIAARHLAGTHAFRSNETSRAAGLVYWQTVDWLVEQGYAELHGAGDYLVRLTTKGVELAVTEGVVTAAQARTIEKHLGH